MVSLANKYRSQTFDDLIGQDHISSILKYQAKESVRQANYLFFWPRGTGKTSSARLLAKALNCLNIEKTWWNPCNTCENCVAINTWTTLDVMEIDAASHTWVDNIREEIIDKLAYRPHTLKKKVIIIDEVHMLSKWAFNALLKTMEEPTEWMVFILATTELNKVPDTIISRCQLFNFQKIPSAQIVDHLKEIAQQENINNNESWLMMIADLSDGCMRDAIKYLDQISVMGDVDEESVAQFLWVVSETLLKEFVEIFETYTNSPTPKQFENIINFLQDINTRGVDLTNFPKQLIQYANRHFLDNAELFSVLSSFAGDLIRQAKWFPHPLLLYKMILYRYWEQDTSPTQQPSAPSTPTPKKPTKPQQPSTTNNPTTPEPPTNNDSTEPQDQSSSKDDSPTTSTNKKQTQLTSVRSSVLEDLSWSLKALLDQQSELQEISDNIATIITTNPLARMSLKQKKNEEKILESLSQHAWISLTHLKNNYMTKEDYFNRHMSNV